MGYFVGVEPGVNLYVEDLNPGGKENIVFLHGWPFSHRQFEYQLNVLPAKGYRCIGIDWRGFGHSDKPIHGYHYDRLADDIRAVVDALRLKDFTLVGHSTGGGIAIRYAARHRGRGHPSSCSWTPRLPGALRKRPPIGSSPNREMTAPG